MAEATRRPGWGRIESGDGVFDRLDRTGLDGLAGRLGRESGGLLGEGVDALARGASRALHYDELRKTGEHEQAVLLELAMADVRKRLQHRFDLLAGGAVTDRLGHDFRYAIDSSFTESSLGWKPEETFDTGIRRTVDWYLANPAHLARHD